MKPTVTIGSMTDLNSALVMKQNYDGNSGFWFGSAGDHTDSLILRSFIGSSLGEMRELRVVEPTVATWAHMVGRNDGQKLSLWRNGTLQATSVAGTEATINHDATWLYFGYRFEGVLDDIRIYDRAISDTEIKALASDPTASND